MFISKKLIILTFIILFIIIGCDDNSITNSEKYSIKTTICSVKNNCDLVSIEKGTDTIITQNNIYGAYIYTRNKNSFVDIKAYEELANFDEVFCLTFFKDSNYFNTIYYRRKKSFSEIEGFLIMDDEIYKLHKNNCSQTHTFEWYHKLAKKGYAFAQNDLGQIYRYGKKGTKVDKEKAFFWLLKSAKQGEELALNNIGTMYLNGEGVSKDKTKALEWFQKSANQKNPKGEYNIGVIYYNQGDLNLATAWFKKSAKHKYKPAIDILKEIKNNEKK